jgi:hypothetical protein
MVSILDQYEIESDKIEENYNLRNESNPVKYFY